jgi:hypothetical protein
MGRKDSERKAEKGKQRRKSREGKTEKAKEKQKKTD